MLDPYVLHIFEYISVTIASTLDKFLCQLGIYTTWLSPIAYLQTLVLLLVTPINCGGFVFGPCLVAQYLVSFQVLQLSHRGRESWLLKMLWLSF